MGFDFNNLYDDTGFKTEFLPHEKVEKGRGLELELNNDIISLDFIDQAKSFVENLVSDIEQTARAAGDAEPDANQPPAAVPVEKSITESVNDNLLVMEGIAQTIRQYARILGGLPGADSPSNRVIKGWNLVRNKKPVKVSYEELVTWKFSLLKKLYNFCVFEAQSVEKKNDKPSGST